MVRLEAPETLSLPQHYMFQFHDGAIRSQSLRASKMDGKKFQFHDGAIRSYAHLLYYSLLAGFNSTMVRLEGTDPEKMSMVIGCFNSTMVRLEGCCGGRTRRRFDVSIPRWCD